MNQAVLDSVAWQDYIEAELSLVVSDMQVYAQDVAEMAIKLVMSEDKVVNLVRKLAEHTSRQMKTVGLQLQTLQGSGVGGGQAAPVNLDTVFGSEQV